MISLQSLTKKYRQTTIFGNLSFTFPNKGLVCLFGASGCGKTTLLNLLAGFDTDYSGDITVQGASLSDMSADALCRYRRENIGFVFQNYHLLDRYTVLDNLLLAAEQSGKTPEENQRNALSLLDRLGIADKALQKGENLSGGQKQRAAIARALINDPSVILADEPTGALDRHNAAEIMNLLKQLAADRLVLVITHDLKCAAFADQIVTMEDGKLIADQMPQEPDTAAAVAAQKEKPSVKASSFRRARKNFRVYLFRYLAVSLAISIGILCFILSLSSGNLVGRSIEEFKEKNTAFNNGYIKIEKNEKAVLDILRGDERIENIYAQYILQNISLTLGNETENMAEKYPMPKAAEKMSYGVMPRQGRREIALSPSLAAKFSSKLQDLIGAKVTLTLSGKSYDLTVSGIYGAAYDDFFVSSDIEKQFYKGDTNDAAYSVSYDVKTFEAVVPVSILLKEKKYPSQNAADQVGTLQNTFQNLTRLFFTISLLILTASILIGVILLLKLQNTRRREIGLLSALGYTKKFIRRMFIYENVLLAASAVTLGLILLSLSSIVSDYFGFGLTVSFPQILLSVGLTAGVTVGTSFLAGFKMSHMGASYTSRRSKTGRAKTASSRP